MTLHIIGIDCAAQAGNIGLALGAHQQGRTAVMDAVGGLAEARLVECLCDWISGKKPVLIAIDAPLGWPAAMAALPSNNRARATPAYIAPQDTLRCKQVKDEIAWIDARMRQGYKARTGESLRNRRRDLVGLRYQYCH